MQIEAGKQYRFIQSDCAGMHSPGIKPYCGKVVTVLIAHALNCYECTLVEFADGTSQYVFWDELHPLVNAEPTLAWRYGGLGIEFNRGEKVVAMASLPQLHQGKTYYVQSIDAQGNLFLAENRHGEQVLVRATPYDPSYFRKV